MLTFNSRSINLRTLTSCSILACALVASADVKTTSKITITLSMGNQPPKTQTATSYYKNGVMRVESSDGSIFIMDSKKKKSLTLNKKEKTYSEFNIDSVTPASASGFMKEAKVKMSGHVKPTTQKMKIAGKTAMKYLLDMTMDMTMPGTQPGQPSMGTMHGDVKGAFWTTTALKDRISGSEMMGAYTEMLKGLSMLGDAKQLKKEFAKFRGLPLNSEMDMTMTMKPAEGSPRAGAGPMTFTMTMKSEVQSISEAPLPASLFVVPKDYKKVKKANFGQGMKGS